MRMKFSDEINEMDKKISPYIVSMVPDIVYKDGTPDEIKEMHKRMIELADKEYMDAIM